MTRCSIRTTGARPGPSSFAISAKMLGFALSPDGRTLLIGYGDPFAGGTTSVPGTLGVFKSATDTFAFTPIFGAHVGCLSWTKQGVYVCASQHFDQFELAFSPDADFSSDAGCLSPLLRLPEVRGPLACPSDTAGFACSLYWQAVCGALGACTDAGTSPAGCAGRDAAATTGDGGGALDAAPEGGVTPPIDARRRRRLRMSFGHGGSRRASGGQRLRGVDGRVFSGAVVGFARANRGERSRQGTSAEQTADVARALRRPDIGAAGPPMCRHVGARGVSPLWAGPGLPAQSQVKLGRQSPLEDDMAWGNKKSTPQQQHSGEEIGNILEASTVVKGDLKSDRGFRIDGTIEGSVESNGAIVIGESGAVDGDVRGGDVIVVGRVEGNILARGHLDIRSTGKVVGDVKAASFRIETGGVFLGTSRMGEEPEEPAGVMNAATSLA